MRWFIVVLMLTMFMFADMMHVIVYASGDCESIDYTNDTSITADYCSNSLIRNTIRPFGVITGDFNLDDYRDSIASTTLFVIYLFVGVIILLNVLIAIVTDAYFRSNKQRYSLLGRARLPILAKHSYLDTKAFHIAKRGPRDCTFITIMVLVALFLLLFAISYSILIRSLLAETSITGNSTLDDFVFEYGSLVMITLMYVTANIAMLVTVKDFFHMKNKFIDESKYIQFLRRPIKPFVYSLLGINYDNEDFIRKEDGLDEDDILPSVKEMIDRGTSRIRNDLQKVKRSLKKSVKRQRYVHKH